MCVCVCVCVCMCVCVYVYEFKYIQNTFLCVPVVQSMKIEKVAHNCMCVCVRVRVHVYITVVGVWLCESASLFIQARI